MNKKKRDFKKNTYYHVYNRGCNKEDIFRSASDKKFFISLLYRYVKKTDLHLDIYTIMNNHFHIILRINKNTKAISKYMQRVCTAYAIYASQKYNRVGHLFQGRYQSKELTYRKDRKQAKEYIRQNPVKAGYVKEASKYPWTKQV